MLSTKLILEGIGQEIVDTLRNDIKTKSLVPGYPPPNASGKLADTLWYEATEESLKVYAQGYIYQLEHGRKPGRKPPLDAIKDWIKVKGIIPKPNERGKAISVNSLAFLIQRKIGAKGTLIYQQGGSDLLASVLNQNFISGVRDKLVFSLVNQIKSEIVPV